MMTVDSSISVGVAGVALGVAASLWQRKAVLESNCAFFSFAKKDLAEAMDGADRVLSDARTPEIIRVMIKNLLVSYYSEDIGRTLAKGFVGHISGDREISPEEVKPEDNPISVAMRELADIDPGLERDAHRAMMTMILGLSVVHFGDHLEASKVQNEGARDPNNLWSKVGRSFGIGNNHHDIGGGVAHA